MYCKFYFKTLPTVTKQYTVTRNTVWQITDKDHILIHITDGCCQMQCGFDTFIAAAGDTVLVPKNHPYVRKPVKGSMCTMTYTHFAAESQKDLLSPTEFTNEIFAQRNAVTHDVLSGTSPQFPKEAFCAIHTQSITPQQSAFLKKINETSNKTTVLFGLYQSASLLEFLLAMAQKACETQPEITELKKSQHVPEKLRQATTYIAEKFTTKITLDEIALHCAVSKSQLIRSFKTQLGKTPVDYITDMRITRAKELIFNHPQLTLKEIAYELGFDNPHYFSRVFHKTAGETPSDYKWRVHHFQEKESTTPKANP